MNCKPGDKVRVKATGNNATIQSVHPTSDGMNVHYRLVELYGPYSMRELERLPADGDAKIGGVKFDTDKPRMDLIDGEAMEELAKVLTFGAKKYAEHNWRKGITLSRLLAALLRHTFAMMRGEDTDEETGLPHAAHAMCCCMFLLWTMKHKPDMDDRYKRTFTTNEIKEMTNGNKR